ncbi:2'-5' RNA ligase family protein [Streptomyces sp. ISL-100]|uniref:2'-5' RNA ligase family protein n=1 Tax=Streptomyces sp. ISL-100 TaxID=2819173 RepID=UPI001BEA7757|nr:hypothetical protein [Streptomyces sp. ISL-100]
MPSARTANAFFSLRVPAELVDALVELQRVHQEHIEPQQRDHMHITLGFLHDADAVTLADAAALLSERTWPTPTIRMSGEVRHGSWQLAAGSCRRIRHTATTPMSSSGRSRSGWEWRTHPSWPASRRRSPAASASARTSSGRM